MNNDEATNCPRCENLVMWDGHDRFEIVGGPRLDQRYVFTERTQICSRGCGWEGSTVLFPHRANPKMRAAHLTESQIVALVELMPGHRADFSGRSFVSDEPAN